MAKSCSLCVPSPSSAANKWSVIKTGTILDTLSEDKRHLCKLLLLWKSKTVSLGDESTVAGPPKGKHWGNSVITLETAFRESYLTSSLQLQAGDHKCFIPSKNVVFGQFNSSEMTMPCTRPRQERLQENMRKLLAFSRALEGSHDIEGFTQFLIAVCSIREQF